MTRAGALKQLVAAGRNARAPHGGGLRPQETLDAIAIRLHPLVERQYHAFHALESLLRIQPWDQLSTDERAAMRHRCADELLPFVSPKALTRAPGHPFPLVGDRRLSLLVAMRDREGSPVHYAIVEVSPELPRFVALTGSQGVVLIEDVIRPNLDLLFPGRMLAGAYTFRLTRSGDLQLDETTTANFLQAIEEELAQRPHQPVLRIELESTTPPALRDLLQRELRFEESDRDSTLSPADVYLADGPVDLGGLQDVASATGQPDYPPFSPADAFAADSPIASQLDAHDVLVYHPRDSFTTSVERFIAEAADDPDVQAIKLTLYRLGGGAASPIAEALRRPRIKSPSQCRKISVLNWG
jgi:polyphosphate kinase